METLDDFKLDFTGNSVFLIETNHGPMEISIKDMDVTLDILRTILKQSSNMPVDSFSDEEEVAMRNILKRLS